MARPFPFSVLLLLLLCALLASAKPKFKRNGTTTTSAVQARQMTRERLLGRNDKLVMASLFGREDCSIPQPSTGVCTCGLPYVLVSTPYSRRRRPEFGGVPHGDINALVVHNGRQVHAPSSSSAPQSSAHHGPVVCTEASAPPRRAPLVAARAASAWVDRARVFTAHPPDVCTCRA